MREVQHFAAEVADILLRRPKTEMKERILKTTSALIMLLCVSWQSKCIAYV